MAEASAPAPSKKAQLQLPNTGTYFAGFPVDPRSPQPIIKNGFGSVTFYLADPDMDQNIV